ncbi:MAG TPA: hypothetical protein VER96_05835 [Polyangiaceae bacterium]|nr:hypothetical protein [Polyangiaceae bacterium]
MKTSRAIATLLAKCLAAALIAVALAGCSSGIAVDEPGPAMASTSALTGALTIDASCYSADVKHLQKAAQFLRVVANSPALATCIQNSFNSKTSGGQLLPPGLNIGPYVPCVGDPAPTTATTINQLMASINPTRISCDYTKLGTSVGGYAQVFDEGNSTNPEVINLGSELGLIQGKSVGCAYSTAPDCAPMQVYTDLADVIGHEIMHQHGYSHVDDNWVDYTPASSAGHLCGIPYSQHPVYDNGVPYMVGECIYAVLYASAQSCQGMYTTCGNGLSLVQSTFTSTPTCSCVQELGAPAYCPPQPCTPPATWNAQSCACVSPAPTCKKTPMQCCLQSGGTWVRNHCE